MLPKNAQDVATVEIRKAMVALENAYEALWHYKVSQQVLEHLQNAFKEGNDALERLSN